MLTGPTIADPTPDSLDAAIAECLEAEDRGGPGDRDIVRTRYPEWADALAAFFATHDRFERLVAPLREIAPRPEPAATGHQVGGYQILTEFARGGMGVIYTARQVELDRVVALKMILTGAHASADERRRFQIEAESAARLDHPNIVPVYEVGEANGRPYYSMKLVAGRNLAEHLGGQPAPPAEAARIVAAVARAVGYAHDRGILHRDLKPANVLIEEETGTAYVTDFGLARRLAEDSRVTPPGTALGTPAYLAPEFLQPDFGHPSQPTTAGDIYALGAILFECLTGRAPFHADSALNTLLAALRGPPPRPRSLVAAVPIDLETICLKCLGPGPEQRYARAADLAADLDRWARGEPVTARPVGPVGRLWRWCRRQPVIAGLLGGLIVSIGVGLGVSYREWQRAEANYRTAENHRQTAEQRGEEAEAHFRAAEDHRRTAEQRGEDAEANFRLAHDAVGRFYEEFAERHLKGVPGMKATRRAALTEARKYYETFVAQRGHDPRLRRELAAAHFRIAVIDSDMGALPAARDGFVRAVAGFEALLAESPDDPRHRRDLPRTIQRLANVQASLGMPTAAAASCLRAKTMFEALAQEEPDDPDHLVDLAAVLHTLGTTYQATGPVSEAGRLFEAKVEVCLTLIRRWPDHPKAPGLLARGLNQCAYVSSALGSPEGYVCWSRAAVGVLEDHLRRQPGDNPARVNLARTYRNLAHRAFLQNQPAQAIALLARARPHLQAATTADPEDAEGLAETVGHYREQGRARLSLKDFSGAIAAYERARLSAEQLIAQAGETPAYQDDLASCYFDIGHAASGQNDWNRAVVAFRTAAEIRSRLIKTDPTQAIFHHRLGMTLGNLAVGHIRQNRPNEAVDACAGAVQADEAAIRLAPNIPAYRGGLANHYGLWAGIERDRGRYAAAVSLIERRRDLFPDNPAELIASAREFARIADRDLTPLPSTEAAACGRAADAAVVALLAAAARGATDYASIRQEKVFDRLRDRLPTLPTNGK